MNAARGTRRPRGGGGRGPRTRRGGGRGGASKNSSCLVLVLALTGSALMAAAGAVARLGPVGQVQVGHGVAGETKAAPPKWGHQPRRSIA